MISLGVTHISSKLEIVFRHLLMLSMVILREKESYILDWDQIQVQVMLNKCNACDASSALIR